MGTPSAVTGHPSNLDPGSTYSVVITATLSVAFTFPEAVESMSAISLITNIASVAAYAGNPVVVDPGESQLFSFLFTVTNNPTYASMPSFTDPVEFLLQILTNTGTPLDSFPVEGYLTWPIPDGLSVSSQPSDSYDQSADGGPEASVVLQASGSDLDNLDLNAAQSWALTELLDDSNSILDTKYLGVVSGLIAVTSDAFAATVLPSAVDQGKIRVSYKPPNYSDISALDPPPSVLTSNFTFVV